MLFLLAPKSALVSTVCVKCRSRVQARHARRRTLASSTRRRTWNWKMATRELLRSTRTPVKNRNSISTDQVRRAG